MTGHRIVTDWMGEEVETLADLLPSHPRAVCVGINPAPRSVAAGHYYQGQSGQRFFRRLESAGVLVLPAQGFEDDAAVTLGIGFTDVVKRPTASADEVGRQELAFGRQVLEAKLKEWSTPAIIFTFKAAAVAMLGQFPGNGWLEMRIAGSQVFVMPGPYESTLTAERTLGTLAERL